nr:nonstructural protein 3 [Bird parvovirus]
MSYLGFSLLLYVRHDSPLLQNLDKDSDAYKQMRDTLLDDAQSLIGCKWNMDITRITSSDGTVFLHGNNIRFTVANKTIIQALGDLYRHIEFIRSAANITPEDLIKYKEAKERWNVEDTEASSGSAGQESQQTYQDLKRKRT